MITRLPLFFSVFGLSLVPQIQAVASAYDWTGVYAGAKIGVIRSGALLSANNTLFR